VADEAALGLVIAARRPDAAAALAADVRRRLPESATAIATASLAGEALERALAGCDLLINATSAGMDGADQVSALDLALLALCPADAFVCDLIYAPAETPLLRAARVRGLRGMNGLPMLLHQGAAAFTLWTGKPAPLAAMRVALGLPPQG
jgi:shikimate dehydrogenase